LHYFVDAAVTGSETCWTQELKANPAHQGGATAGKVEDWNSLLLADGVLTPERPLLGEKDDLPQFTRELLQVKWRQAIPSICM
jgi:hypothetical protein